jgi:c-di-GMP-binding flagellar brake protein YcgR
MARAAERRQDKRFPLACPVVLLDDEKDSPLKARTVNVSDGGLLLSMPSEAAPEQDRRLTVRLLVPRSTPNTYMLEEFVGQARVLRHQELADDSSAVAVQFVKRLRLDLEV